MLHAIMRRLVTVPVAVCALTAVIAIVAMPAVRAADDNLSYSDKEEIENLLKQKAADLASEKDKDGIGFKRGSYSKTFKPVGSSMYTVAFSQDTIEPEGKDATQQMKTERFDLTIGKDAKGKWSIAKQDLKDTYVGLYRGFIGGEWIYKFDGLHFEKEGLKVSAAKGWAYAHRRLGQMVGFTVFADDLSFGYAPPTDTPETGHYGALYKKIAKQYPDDLVFKPERLGLSCDDKTCAEFMTSAFSGLQKVGTPDGSGGGASASDSQGRMIKRFKDAADEDKKARRDTPFVGFDLVDDPDHRYWQFGFKRSGPKEHYAGLIYDNFSPWQMSYYATDYGQIFAYYSEDSRSKGIDPLMLEEREDEDARDYELVSVKGGVDLGLDDSTAYSGDITFKLKIKRELKALPFALSRQTFAGEKAAAKNPKLFVNSVQDADGTELTWTRLTSYSNLVILPKTAHAGEVITLRLQFINYDAIYQLTPSFFIMSREGWLPFARVDDFINEFDLTVRLNDKYQVLGPGKVESETVKDGIRTTRFLSPSPLTFPTIIFGNYISDDAGKYQATKIDGTVIPVRVYVDKGSLAERGIRASQLRSIATQAAVALNLYRDTFGIDYPFAKLDLVCDPEGFAYGQAPASIIFLGFALFRGEGTVAEVGGSNLTKFNKDTVAHETGHQWWGGLVTNTNERNYWFVESLAEVASAVYVEKTQGMKQYLEKVDGWRKVFEASGPLASVQDSYTTYAGNPENRPVIANIYNRGPYAFHMFRSTFGDAKFYQLLKDMAQGLAHKEIATREMQEIMEKVVGGNMDWFFNQWIRGVGTPQYATNWTKRKNEQGKWIVEGSIKQRVVMGLDKTEIPGVYFKGVAPLTFIDLNGKEVKSQKPMLVQGAETPFKVIVADEPEQVVFNKDGEILAEDPLTNKSW